ncbi:alpha/beta hydrolase [Fodinicola feengrottensis]|uniref:Alpha/beta hydrolase n=2 Tax=Fodinicola feengrottensis TaxID=435914 RepID=A0ABN2J110_9ACTN
MTLVLRASKARAARRFARTGGPGPVAAPAEPPASLMKACVVTKRDFEGLPAYEIVPKNAPKPTKTLLYLHGGGYVSPILTAHWWLVHRLAVANGIRVLVPFYQLAPKGTHRDAFPRLLRYYEKALTSAESVIIGGDSAGGGLALALAAQIREAGLTSPARLLLFAPWLDVTMKNPDIGDLANTDPMLTLPRLIEAGRLWAGDDSPDLPSVSPINEDLAGLPPIEVFVGTNDMLVADCRKLATKAGTPVVVHEYPGAFHVFIAVVLLPESRRALAEVSAVIASAG